VPTSVHPLHCRAHFTTPTVTHKPGTLRVLGHKKLFLLHEISLALTVGTRLDIGALRVGQLHHADGACGVGAPGVGAPPGVAAAPDACMCVWERVRGDRKRETEQDSERETERQRCLGACRWWIHTCV